MFFRINFTKFINGKNGETFLPRFDYITISKYQVNIININASPNSMNIDIKSEYRVYEPYIGNNEPLYYFTKRSKVYPLPRIHLREAIVKLNPENCVI